MFIVIIAGLFCSGVWVVCFAAAAQATPKPKPAAPTTLNEYVYRAVAAAETGLPAMLHLEVVHVAFVGTSAGYPVLVCTLSNGVLVSWCNKAVYLCDAGGSVRTKVRIYNGADLFRAQVAAGDIA